MGKKKQFEIDPNILFVLTQKLDMFEKSGALETIKATQDLKISVVSLEKDVETLKTNFFSLDTNKREKPWRLLGVFFGPLVALTIVFGGYINSLRNEIHCLRSEVQVMKSITEERDREYEYKYLKKEDYLRDSKGKRNEHNTPSRR